MKEEPPVEKKILKAMADDHTDIHEKMSIDPFGHREAVDEKPSAEHLAPVVDEDSLFKTIHDFKDKEAYEEYKAKLLKQQKEEEGVKKESAPKWKDLIKGRIIDNEGKAINYAPSADRQLQITKEMKAEIKKEYSKLINAFALSAPSESLIVLQSTEAKVAAGKTHKWMSTFFDNLVTKIASVNEKLSPKDKTPIPINNVGIEWVVIYDEAIDIMLAHTSINKKGFKDWNYLRKLSFADKNDLPVFLRVAVNDRDALEKMIVNLPQK
ncbi:MAG: hypothetical protein AAB623_01030 [Patescibacteria group bacterium]